MRTLLLTSVALSALLMAAPAYAQHQGHHRGEPDSTTAAPAATPAATPVAAPAATPAAAPATDNPTQLSGRHDHGGRGHDNAPAAAPAAPQAAPALIPGTPILAPGGQGAHHDNTGHDNNGGRGDWNGRDNNGGRDNNAGRDNGRGDNNAGRDNNGGRDNNRWNGRGAGHNHNNAFDAFRRAFNAPRHYHHGRYHRPSGYYYQRWTLGAFLPSLFYTQSYWISDYEDFDLSDPPRGTVWVRYGDDALLIDRYTGEVIEVEYGIFY